MNGGVIPQSRSDKLGDKKSIDQPSYQQNYSTTELCQVERLGLPTAVNDLANMTSKINWNNPVAIKDFDNLMSFIY